MPNNPDKKSLGAKQIDIDAPPQTPVNLADLPKAPALAEIEEQPLTRNLKAYKEILERLRSSIVLPTDLGGDLPKELASLSSGFTFSSSPQDDDFRFWHVEALINQAADLLDRCLRERAAWEENVSRAFELRLVVEEFAQLDKIHEQEILAGYYTLAYKGSCNEALAEASTKAGSAYAKYILDLVNKYYYSESEIVRQSAFSQLAAWVSHYATYKEDHKTDLLQCIWNGVGKSIPDHLHDSATGMSYHQLLVQQLLYLMESEGRGKAADASDFRRRAKQHKADWDFKDAAFRRSRTQVGRDLADLRAKAYSQAGGALNYWERLGPIRERFNRDFRDALARILSADEGMRKIYGYGTPMNLKLRSAYAGKTDFELLDLAVAYVRDVISWLVRFSQLDQNYVFPISLRRTLGKDTWETGGKEGAWRLVLTEAHFPQQVHIRLRGVSAFCVPDDDSPLNPWQAKNDGLWQMDVTAPVSGRVTHLSGSTIQLDQSLVPPCRLGRVGRRRPVHDTEINGIQALHNVSPVGEWTVRCSKFSTSGSKLDDLDDIVIELHLAVRYRK